MISAEASAVRDQLIAKGLETPTIDNGMNQEQRYEKIKGFNVRRRQHTGYELRRR